MVRVVARSIAHPVDLHTRLHALRPQLTSHPHPPDRWNDLTWTSGEREYANERPIGTQVSSYTILLHHYYTTAVEKPTPCRPSAHRHGL